MIKEYFEKLRFDKDHHTELGDIRLTIGQQEEIIKIFEEALKKQRELYKRINGGGSDDRSLILRTKETK